MGDVFTLSAEFSRGAQPIEFRRRHTVYGTRAGDRHSVLFWRGRQQLCALALRTLAEQGGSETCRAPAARRANPRSNSEMKLLDDLIGSRQLKRVRPAGRPIARVAISTQPVFGSWGGGNQWVLQMARYLGFCGYEVRFDLHGEVDAIFINHSGITGKLSFGLEEIIRYKEQRPCVRVIHRINDNDQRKQTTQMDALLAQFNAVADHTVFISEWLRDHHAARWFDARRPHTSILNGADPSIFHSIGSRTWRENEPFRMVTHHWSDNVMKGFPQYAALDGHIAAGDLPAVELWIIGRWPDNIVWKRARTFPPVSGTELARLLRECHAYITASLYEPGGMHFIEGLQCGLPLLYHLDGGGIVELGQKYGVGFRDDLLTAFRNLRESYPTYRERVLASPPSGDRMCLAYRQILQRLLTSE